MKNFQHTVAVVANGAIHNDEAIASLIKSYSMIVAADGGLNHCHRMGIAPSMIIGDGDSIDPAILPHYADVPFRKFPKLKNETDLELAVQSVFTPEVEKIGLFGVLGDRTDHSLANLHLIRRYPGKVFIESETETVFASCNNMDLTVKPGQTISLIHIDGPVQGVTTQGLQWELKDACFDKYFFSVSNICLTDRINISIRCGELLCILQK